MLSEHPISQRTWHEGIDVDLAARLLTETSRPGVVSMRVCRRVLGWIEYLELRRALAASIAQRWAGAGHLRAPDHPIVHAGWVSAPMADTAFPGPRAPLPGILPRTTAIEGANPPAAGGAALHGEPRAVTRGEPLSPAPFAPLAPTREAPALTLVQARPAPLPAARAERADSLSLPLTMREQPVSGAAPEPTAAPSPALSIRRDQEKGGAPPRDPPVTRPDSARMEEAVKRGRSVEPMPTEMALARGLADSMRAGVSRTRASRSGVVSPAPEAPLQADTPPPAPPLPRVPATSPASSASSAPDLQHRIEGGDSASGAPPGAVPAPNTLQNTGARWMVRAGGAESTSAPVADSPEPRAVVRVPARGRSHTDQHDGNDGAVFTRPVVTPSNLGPTLSDLRRTLESAAVRPRPPSAERASAPAPLVPVLAPAASGARTAAWPGFEDASGPPGAAARAQGTSPVMGTALPAPSPGERSATPRREPPEASSGREPRVDIESIVDQVQRRLMKQLAVERERRGARR